MIALVQCIGGGCLFMLSVCDWPGIVKEEFLRFFQPFATSRTALICRPVVGRIMPPSNQRTTNRRGCYVIGAMVLGAVLLFGAIGLGFLGDLDLGKISGLPIFDNM